MQLEKIIDGSGVKILSNPPYKYPFSSIVWEVCIEFSNDGDHSRLRMFCKLPPIPVLHHITNELRHTKILCIFEIEAFFLHKRSGYRFLYHASLGFLRK